MQWEEKKKAHRSFTALFTLHKGRHKHTRQMQIKTRQVITDGHLCWVQASCVKLTMCQDLLLKHFTRLTGRHLISQLKLANRWWPRSFRQTLKYLQPGQEIFCYFDEEDTVEVQLLLPSAKAKLAPSIYDMYFHTDLNKSPAVKASFSCTHCSGWNMHTMQLGRPLTSA